MSSKTLRSPGSWRLLATRAIVVTLHIGAAFAFVPNGIDTSSATVATDARTTTRQISSLLAKPRRLEENVEGALYVNDRCINCAACSNFAPQSFARETNRDVYHYVFAQPQTTEEMDQARAALAACPVAAIRLETKAERQHRAADKSDVTWTDDDEKIVQGLRIGGTTDKGPPFPRLFLQSVPSVYWMGHHNDKSFGATPYLFQATHQGKEIWIMVDTPRFGTSAQRAVASLTGPDGPDYLFLTHVDDTADHQKWVELYNKGGNNNNNLRRILHTGDLGRHNWLGDRTLEDVEILLTQQPSSRKSNKDLTAYSLKGQVLDKDWYESYPEEVVILHTPGHSPGSITLYRRPNEKDDKPGILFTGDTLAWTTRLGGRMTGMGRYGNDLQVQVDTLERLLDLDWQIIAPGHLHPRDYRSIVGTDKQKSIQKDELSIAMDDLLVRNF